MMTADVMASEGYRDVGYEYVTVDDCWLANDRDKDGKLQPDPARFPSGMKALADYVSRRRFNSLFFSFFLLLHCGVFFLFHLDNAVLPLC